jgi:hypothetical protein
MRKRTLLVAVSTDLDTDDLRPDDCEVPGTYEVAGIDADLPDGHAADAALSSFHTSQAVEVLDDFRFAVLDPETKLELSPDADADRDDELDCDKIDVNLPAWYDPN